MTVAAASRITGCPQGASLILELFWSMLLDQQHAFHALLVIVIHQGGVIQITFLVGGFLSQDMTMISMLSLDFTSAGELETFLGTCFCF
jgi:hypothetical protein